MNRLIILLSLICSFNVYGQVWEHVSQSPDSDFYIDSSSVNRNGSKVTFSQLTDYQEGYDYNNEKLFSIKQSRIIDCDKNSFRTIGMIGYSKINGEGNILVVNPYGSNYWIDINSNSLLDAMKNKFCQ